ncbi:hypothetical protein PENSPDRAFT_659397 [Peniophora sp. CONT]|nr:hypothetical protein PENSPDRAFT_659397 [Peniophora sp. CONT]
MLSSSITTIALLAVASVNATPTPQFTLPNRFPGANGNLPFGLNFANSTAGGNAFPFAGLLSFLRGANGNTGFGTGNRTTSARPFPFNFLPFKRDEELEARDPQFSFDFSNRLPVTGNLPFGINIAQGANGNSIANFGNATTGDRGFPLNLFPFKRDDELVKRDPQFSFNFPNRLPISGNFNGFTIGQGPNGNSIITFGNSTSGRTSPFNFFGGGSGNATTNNRPFPFNFLPFKRDEEIVKRDPQFSFNFPNRLPVIGNLPFGINIGQGANGNSIANFGNATTGTQAFPFNFLNFKREEEIAARDEVEKRDPQFSFNFPNRLPVTGNLPFGINIAQGADGNSIGNFGNATTGTQAFPFNFLNFKREE